MFWWLFKIPSNSKSCMIPGMCIIIWIERCPESISLYSELLLFSMIPEQLINETPSKQWYGYWLILISLKTGGLTNLLWQFLLSASCLINISGWPLKMCMSWRYAPLTSLLCNKNHCLEECKNLQMVLKATDNDQSIHRYANSSAHTNSTTIFALHFHHPPP